MTSRASCERLRETLNEAEVVVEPRSPFFVKIVHRSFPGSQFFANIPFIKVVDPGRHRFVGATCVTHVIAFSRLALP